MVGAPAVTVTDWAPPMTALSAQVVIAVPLTPVSLIPSPFRSSPSSQSTAPLTSSGEATWAWAERQRIAAKIVPERTAGRRGLVDRGMNLGEADEPETGR